MIYYINSLKTTSADSIQHIPFCEILVFYFFFGYKAEAVTKQIDK